MAQAGYQGINDLQKAEEEASRLITDARNMRQQLVEQGRLESKQQIDKYRNKMDEEFKLKQQAKLGDDQQKEIKNLEQQTSDEIETLKKDYASHKNEVIDLLISSIVQVDVAIPEKRKFHN
ncbi:hypothetical protein WA158_008357 [Blastocystis sp. Blastoise]